MPARKPITTRRPVQKRRLTPTQQIERTPHIATLEEAWGKNPRQKIRPISLKRSAYGVRFRSDKLAKFRAQLHTHLAHLKTIQALPTWTDLRHFIKQNKRGIKRQHIIVSVNRTGKVTGYSFVRMPKVTRGLIRNVEMACSVEMRHGSIGQFRPNEALEGIQRNGFHIRFVPVKGYYFDKESGTFKRKSKP